MDYLTKNIVLDNKQFKIVVIGDVHVGDALCDIKLFERTIKYIAETPNCYCILNGDLMNNALKFSKSDIYQATMSIEEQQEFLIKSLMPIKDKILAMTTGNHERRTSRDAGINPLRYIANSLNVPDLLVENAFVLEISVLNPNTNRKENSYIVHGIHGGHGGGRRAGATANALEDMCKVVVNADLYIHNHTHTPLFYSDVALVYYSQTKLLAEKNRMFVNGNAFLKYGGYAEEKGFKLVDRTPSVLIIRQVENEKGTRKMITDVVKI